MPSPATAAAAPPAADEQGYKAGHEQQHDSANSDRDEDSGIQRKGRQEDVIL
jgi:hypothetical protein